MSLTQKLGERECFAKVSAPFLRGTQGMFGIGMPELIIILVIILIIFGAGKLPEIGGAVGKGIKNFKKSFQDQEEVEDTKDTKKIEEDDQ